MTNNDASVTTDSIHSKTLQPLHEPLNDLEMTLPQSNFAVMKNVVVVGFAFLLLFTSFQSIQNLQSSLNEEENIGLISLIIVYTSLIISCMFVPPMLISRIGCKWTLVASMSCYVAYIAANYYPRWYTLGFTSVLLGKLCDILLEERKRNGVPPLF